MQRYLYDYLVFGGYPDVVLADTIEERHETLLELRNSYAQKDIQEAGLRNADIYRNLMKILADQTGQLLNIHTLSGELGIDGKTVQKYLWVMRKSFHVHIVHPFHQRVASELRKMPKIYFADLGLRNCLLNNLAPLGTRQDQGTLLENYVYLCLRNQADEDRVKYWRTQNKQEVDFIVQHITGTASAYEIKYSRKQFNESKYQYFKSQYPEIPLNCVSLDNVLELKP
jgi:hypothetical protein